MIYLPSATQILTLFRSKILVTLRLFPPFFGIFCTLKWSFFGVFLFFFLANSCIKFTLSCCLPEFETYYEFEMEGQKIL